MRIIHARMGFPVLNDESLDFNTYLFGWARLNNSPTCERKASGQCETGIYPLES